MRLGSSPEFREVDPLKRVRGESTEYADAVRRARGTFNHAEGKRIPLAERLRSFKDWKRKNPGKRSRELITLESGGPEYALRRAITHGPSSRGPNSGGTLPGQTRDSGGMWAVRKGEVTGGSGGMPEDYAVNRSEGGRAGTPAVMQFQAPAYAVRGAEIPGEKYVPADLWHRTRGHKIRRVGKAVPGMEVPGEGGPIRKKKLPG
jgi:hypothetical protein